MTVCAPSPMLFLLRRVFSLICKYMNTFVSLFHRPHLLWNKSISSAKKKQWNAVFDPILTW